MIVVGFDIGGTKCASVIAEVNDGISFLARKQFATTCDYKQVLDRLISGAIQSLTTLGLTADCCGVSCGGPLDAEKGLILSPPNLHGWDNVSVCDYVFEKTGWRTRLCNDADACALAEYRFGAGKGTDNFIFLTFGTGLGAGLVLNGKLYSGKNNMAGEIGHIRLRENGPTGYGKKGSFEGFCSGGGIAKLAEDYFNGLRQPPVYWHKGLAAKELADEANDGDEHAIKLFAKVGKMFGEGLAVLVDTLNPEVIAVGGIYMRCENLLRDTMLASLKKQALPRSLEGLRVVSASLGEHIGDYGAVCAALNKYEPKCLQ